MHLLPPRFLHFLSCLHAWPEQALVSAGADEVKIGAM
jgi:hypothetical protein